MTKNNNVIWRHATIKRADREKLNGHKSAALWFTGRDSHKIRKNP